MGIPVISEMGIDGALVQEFSRYVTFVNDVENHNYVSIKLISADIYKETSFYFNTIKLIKYIKDL